MALGTVGSYRSRGPAARHGRQRDGRGRGRKAGDRRFSPRRGPIACVELTAARAPRFAWQRRFRAAGNRVSLGAIVAQSTIARNFLRGEPWPDELKIPGWRRGGSSWLLMLY